MSDDFNLESLKMSDEDIACLNRLKAEGEPSGIAAALAKERKQKRERTFVMVPLAWKDKLATVRAFPTYAVALELLHRQWRLGNPVSLSNVTAATIGVERRQKWRALKELEQLGLIKINRRPRKSPTITVLKTLDA